MRDRFGTTTVALLLAAVLAALICVISVSNSNTVEARYLPTRSDKSETETLKDIIRGLLADSGAVPLPSRQQLPYYQHLPPARLAYLQRRSAEMSVSSSNGGGDESEVGYPASPFDSTGSPLGFKPMSQRPDR